MGDVIIAEIPDAAPIIQPGFMKEMIQTIMNEQTGA
jgi:hypothetical protein